MIHDQRRRRSHNVMILIGLFAAASSFFTITMVLPIRTTEAQNVTKSPNNTNNKNDTGIAYFTLWNDPTENAFTVLIPKGWIVQPYLGLGPSGVIRTLNGGNNADFIFNVTDPSGRDQIFGADAAPYYDEPNPALGLNEGSIYPGSNSNIPNVYYYRNAVDYVKQFTLPFLQIKHPDAQIVNIKDISSPQTPYITGASVLFSYTNNGEQYLLGADVFTGNTGPGPWYVIAFGTSAPKSDFYHVSNLAQMVIFSPKINKDWAIAEIHGRESRTNIILNEQEAVANIINKHTPSGIDSRLSQAWSDTILGSSEWVSNTGSTYNLPNDFQHYWVDPSQNIAASNTNTSPGPEFTQLTHANGK